MPTDAKKAGNARHVAKLDLIKIQPYKEEGAAIRAAAAGQGQSVQGFVLQAVREHMGGVKQTVLSGSGGETPPKPADGKGGISPPREMRRDTRRPAGAADTQGQTVPQSAGGPQDGGGSGGSTSTPPAPQNAQEAAQKGQDAPSAVNASEMPVQAAETARGPGVVSIPADAYKIAQEAAERAGEAIPVFVSRAVRSQAVRDRVEQEKEQEAAERPQRVQVIPKSGLFGKPPVPVVFGNPAIGEAVPFLCEMLNQGESKARYKGRSRISSMSEYYVTKTIKAGYTLDEIKAAVSLGAQTGYTGGWSGLLECCKRQYGRRTRKP